VKKCFVGAVCRRAGRVRDIFLNICFHHPQRARTLYVTLRVCVLLCRLCVYCCYSNLLCTHYMNI